MAIVLKVALVIAGAVGYWFLVERDPVRFGSGANPESLTLSNAVIGYLFTLIGVLAGSAFRLLSKLKESKSPLPSFGKFVALLFQSFDVWLGLCASPLVYAMLVQSTGGGSLAGLATIGIQNGFVCTIIASAFIKSREDAAS